MVWKRARCVAGLVGSQAGEGEGEARAARLGPSPIFRLEDWLGPPRHLDRCLSMLSTTLSSSQTLKQQLDAVEANGAPWMRFDDASSGPNPPSSRSGTPTLLKLRCFSRKLLHGLHSTCASPGALPVPLAHGVPSKRPPTRSLCSGLMRRPACSPPSFDLLDSTDR